MKQLVPIFKNTTFVPNIIYKYKNNKLYHKQLTNKSFNIFSKITKLAFENLNLSDTSLGRQLTLSLFIYYKIEKDSKIVYLYNDYISNKYEKKKNLQPYGLWGSENFWIEFFNLEFEFNNKYGKEIEEEYFKDVVNDDNIKKFRLIKTVFYVSSIMFKLNLDKNIIINIIEKIILPVFINCFVPTPC